MNIFRKIWRDRVARTILLILGSLLTLYVLFWAWMNYSGAHHWAEAQAMLRKEGETLDFRAVVATPVPEEKNFCSIPALKDLALVVDQDPTKGGPGTKRKRLEDTALANDKDSHSSSPPSLARGTFLGKPVDLKAWADWLRQEGSLPMPPDSGNAAHDVLSALSKHDALFAEFAAGLNRPEAHWTPEWKTRELPEMLFAVPLPHYQASSRLVHTLALRAIAGARAGDSATAHQSLLVGLRLTRASLNDPFLIGELVACTGATQLENAVWEVCDAHAGSAEDFGRLQEELAKLNFAAGLLHNFRGEMAGGVGAVLWLKQHCDTQGVSFVQNLDAESRPGFLSSLLLKAIPGGLFDMNAATMADMEFTYLIKPLRDKGLSGSLAAGDAMEEMLTHQMPRYRLDKFFAKITIPAFDKIVARTAYTQCLTNQAITACALERWFIEHHQYPDSLALIGQPIPVDPLSGKPMGYRKTPDGKYALWYAGFDGVDGGGKRELDAKKPDSTKFYKREYKGDWVWSYQPN